MATVAACAFFIEAGNTASASALAGVSVALLLAGVLFGSRCLSTEKSIKCLTVGAAATVVAWWGLSDGEVSPAEVFMFAGLAAWMGVSLYSIAAQQ